MIQDTLLSAVAVKNKLYKIKKNFEENYGFPCSKDISIQVTFGRVGGEWLDQEKTIKGVDDFNSIFNAIVNAKECLLQASKSTIKADVAEISIIYDGIYQETLGNLTNNQKFQFKWGSYN